MVVQGCYKLEECHSKLLVTTQKSAVTCSHCRVIINALLSVFTKLIAL